MSNFATVIVQLRTACHNCFTSQIKLMEQAHSVHETMKADTVNLFIYLHQLNKRNQLNPLPDLDDATVAEIATVSAVTSDVTDDDELKQLRDKLTELLRKVGSLPEIVETDDELILTGNLVNKEMIALLFMMLTKIRNAVNRSKTPPGSAPSYNKKVYKNARKRAMLAQHTYLGLLNNDVVFCEQNEVATLMDIIYPAIDDATGNTFVDALKNLADFLEARVLGTPLEDLT